MANTKGRKPTKNQATQKRKAESQKLDADEIQSRGAADPGKSKDRRKRPIALSEERTHKLRKDQLMKYRMLEAEARAAQSAFQMADMQYNVLVNSRPDIVSAQSLRKAAQEAFRKARDEYRGYVDELGKGLGLDMSRVGIDDQTGLVREMPIPAEENKGQ